MQLTFTQITSLAAGRWEQIHRALGVALSTTNHQKHTPCPGCGDTRAVIEGDCDECDRLADALQLATMDWCRE